MRERALSPNKKRIEHRQFAPVRPTSITREEIADVFERHIPPSPKRGITVRIGDAIDSRSVPLNLVFEARSFVAGHYWQLGSYD